MVCIEEVGHCVTIATSAKLSRNYQAKWAVIEAFQLNRGLRGDSFKRQSANITNALNSKRTYPSSLLAPFFKTLRDLAGSVPEMSKVSSPQSILCITQVKGEDWSEADSCTNSPFFSTKDEAASNLDGDVRSYIEKLGSRYVNVLGWRDMWAFIFQQATNQRKTSVESHQRSPDFDSWGNDVTIRAYLKRETGMSSECSWEQNDAGRRRAEFCQKFEGYGRVCHCEYSIQV